MRIKDHVKNVSNLRRKQKQKWQVPTQVLIELWRSNIDYSSSGKRVGCSYKP